MAATLVRRFSSRPRIPPLSLLTRDIEAATGLTSDGVARIAPSGAKGWGAFATRDIKPLEQVTTYRGEVYRGLRSLHARYGKEGVIPPAFADANRGWREERESRGVSVTGEYVFQCGVDHSTGLVIMVDGEDVAHASWARFINHSRDAPNLRAKCELLPPSAHPDGADGGDGGGGPREKDMLRPLVTFFTTAGVKEGEELLFDYGPNFYRESGHDGQPAVLKDALAAGGGGGGAGGDQLSESSTSRPGHESGRTGAGRPPPKLDFDPRAPLC